MPESCHIGPKEKNKSDKNLIDYKRNDKRPDLILVSKYKGKNNDHNREYGTGHNFKHTDMTKVLPEEQREAMLTQVPLGRLGAGDDIANAVLFLASEGGAYITGETLHVNGGMVMD